MDMPEQEIIRQSLGDTIEGVDNEVEVIPPLPFSIRRKFASEHQLKQWLTK